MEDLTPEQKQAAFEEKMWLDIREAYSQGEDALRYAVQYYAIGVPEVYLRAKSESWGPVGYAHIPDPVLDINSLPPLKDITALDVQSAHRTDLARMRLLANLIDAKLRNDIIMGCNIDTVIRHLEKMTNIYARVIPIERVCYGLDASDGDDNAPDSITIGGKK